MVAIKSSQRADQRRQLVAAASVPVSRFDMSPSDKSAVFFFRHPVGVTGGPLDAFAVKHCDFISASVDQLLRLRFCSASVTPGRLPQASKPRILSERKEIVADAVVGHQIQRANRWVDAGARIGDGGLSRLHHERLDEFEKQDAQRTACLHGLA